jgi:Phage integrase, N-terminal SAM-like domain
VFESRGMASVRKRVIGGRIAWEVRYRDPDRRHRGKTFRRKLDADRFARSVEVDKLEGRWTDPARGRTPFANWAEDWMRGTIDLRVSTRARDKRLLDEHLLPRFGRRQLAAIGQPDVRAWIAELSARGLAPSTVAKCYQLLSKIMGAAVDAGMIALSPCRRVPLPKIERDETRFLAPGEVARLVEQIDERYRALVLLGAYGGCEPANWRGSGADVSTCFAARSTSQRSSSRSKAC